MEDYVGNRKQNAGEKASQQEKRQNSGAGDKWAACVQLRDFGTIIVPPPGQAWNRARLFQLSRPGGFRNLHQHISSKFTKN